MTKPRRRTRGGFTLIELLVVILIIGVLAAIAIPQFFRVVEKANASEAMSALDSIRGAQERYLTKTGGFYCTAAFSSCTGFDLQIPTLLNYTLGTPTSGMGNPSWQITATRNPPTSVYYGAYTITYDVEPNSPPIVTCSTPLCQTDLIP